MRYFYLSVLAFLCFCILSCSKSSESTPVNNTITLSAKVNGVAWTANEVWSSKQISSPAQTVIVGEDTNTAESINIYLFDYNNTTGTFNADATTARCSWNNTYSTSGVVEVTSVDGGFIKGKFNFVTYDSTHVTEGVFTVYKL